MASVFMSYAREDRVYHPLLVSVLKAHRVDVWYDTAGIPAGTKFDEALHEGLAAAETLIVVVTQAALRSKWVAREVATFTGMKPDGRVLPLLFEPVAPDELFDGLGRVQAIPFHHDLDAGFRALLAAFGKEFLPVVENRSGVERRRADRRRERDRRRTAVWRRLGWGMWRDYRVATGATEFGYFGEAGPALPIEARRNSGGMHELIDATLSTVEPHERERRARRNWPRAGDEAARLLLAEDAELTRYRITNKETGEPVRLTVEMLRALVYIACRQMENEAGCAQNVLVIETVANTIVETYDVAALDRRQGERRAGADRRAPAAP